MLRETIGDLEAVFRDDKGALAGFLNRPARTMRSLFFTVHLPLLLLFPVFSLLCPYRWISGGRLSWTGEVFAPLVLVLGAMVLAGIYDKLLEYGTLSPLYDVEKPELKNVALFLHLPLASGGLAFFVHPVAGYAMIFTLWANSLLMSVRAQADLRGLSMRHAGLFWLYAFLIVAFAACLLAFVLGLFR